MKNKEEVMYFEKDFIIFAILLFDGFWKYEIRYITID